MYFYIPEQFLFCVRRVEIQTSHRDRNTPASNQVMGMIQDSELKDKLVGKSKGMDVEY